MSIDRRSFVQSAVLAVGGGAGVAATEASAQTGVQLAQAWAQPAAAPVCPGPYKPYNGNYGDQAQKNYGFVRKLFDKKNYPKLREDLWNSDEATLRAIIKAELGVDLDPKTRVFLVDIETGRAKAPDGQIDHKNECWYAFVLPPVPRRHHDAVYYETQGWEAAWHSAIVDGYGM